MGWWVSFVGEQRNATKAFWKSYKAELRDLSARVVTCMGWSWTVRDGQKLVARVMSGFRSGDCHVWSDQWPLPRPGECEVWHCRWHDLSWVRPFRAVSSFVVRGGVYLVSSDYSP